MTPILKLDDTPLYAWRPVIKIVGAKKTPAQPVSGHKLAIQVIEVLQETEQMSGRDSEHEEIKVKGD